MYSFVIQFLVASFLVKTIYKPDISPFMVDIKKKSQKRFMLVN